MLMFHSFNLPRRALDDPSITQTLSFFLCLSLSEGSLAPSTPLLINHRWVIPANDTVALRVRFRSEELGQFDQTLNFEIMGTRRRYQLFCRGVCAFPTISREPRVVFPHRRKLRKPEEIVHKKYVLSSETFEFGPLLCGKVLLYLILRGRLLSFPS